MSDSTSDLLEEICTERESVDSPTLEQIVILAVEIAREGREGRKIGTIFTVGDSEAVLEHSRPMILDPLQGHASADTSIKSANVRETLKELAQLDGAFVIDNRGTALSAARYLDADTAGIDMPLLTRSDEQMTVLSRME
jgi:DNA integrity scanning protein DisA with diadenylate cyclase activity